MPLGLFRLILAGWDSKHKRVEEQFNVCSLKMRHVSLSETAKDLTDGLADALLLIGELRGLAIGRAGLHILQKA